MSSSVPVSLGKPSLRRRLEAYYSLIAPDQTANEAVWLNKFQQIYAKFGGSFEGERKLAAKLEAKYGSTVRLLLAESVGKKVVTEQYDVSDQRDDAWYDLTEHERDSGIVDFCSTRFDPVAALKAIEGEVYTTNPFLKSCPRMDRLDQTRSLLPKNDPFFRPAQRRAVSDNPTKDTCATTKKPSSLFAPLVENIDKGPFIVLYQALLHRKRVRVVIRYVNGIRGTLTGHLMAYDKHMNLLLKDVLEVYSLRHTERESKLTNVEQELLRRHEPARQRHMRQILVRGDNVVLIYHAESERSAYPKTSKSPKGSIYKKRDVNADSMPHEMGTVGSLLYAQQRKHNKTSYSST